MLDENSNCRGDVHRRGENEMNFASMSIDELWELREMVEKVVAEKIADKMNILNRSLEQLSQTPASFHREHQKPRTRKVGPILLPSSQNTAIQRDQQEREPVGESDRGGWPRTSSQANKSKTFDFSAAA
jgi:hypothetical protein